MFGTSKVTNQNRVQILHNPPTRVNNLAHNRALVLILVDHRRQKHEIGNMEYEVEEEIIFGDQCGCDEEMQIQQLQEPMTR